MRRWTAHLLQALAVVGHASYPTGAWYQIEPRRQSATDPRDDAAMQAAFLSVVEHEQGTATPGDDDQP